MDDRSSNWITLTSVLPFVDGQGMSCLLGHEFKSSSVGMGSEAATSLTSLDTSFTLQRHQKLLGVGLIKSYKSFNIEQHGQRQITSS